MSQNEGKEVLNEAFDSLEEELPQKIARAVHWLRSPQARWVRWPLGLLLIVGGFFGFLPILGVEFIPVGLLLTAQDIPFLRKPMGRLTLWLLKKYHDVKLWWRSRKMRRQHE